MVSKKLSGGNQTGSENAQYPDSNTMPEQYGGVFTGAGMFVPMNAYTMKAITGGINSLIMTGMYHAFKGEGFENDYSKMNWNNMTMSAYDLGNFFGAKVNAWVQERGARADAYDEAQQNRQSNGASRENFENARQDDIGFFDRAMQMLSTGYKWLDSADKAIKGVFQDIGEIAGTWLQGLGCMALEGIEALGEGIAGLWNGAKEVVSSMWNGVFGGSANVNNITSPINDPEWQKMVREKSTQKWILDMYYKDSNFMKMVDDLGLDPELKKIAKDMNRLDSIYSMIDKNNLSDGKKLANSLTHEETIELVNIKARLSKNYDESYTVTDVEKSALFHALWQGISDGPIMNEIKELLSENKDFAKKLDGVKYNNEKYKFNMNDSASIENYAKYVASNACLLVSIMGAMILTGSEKAPDSFAEFYKEAKDSGLIGKIEPNVSYQQIFDHFLGKDAVKLELLGGCSSYAKMENAYKYSQAYDEVIGGFFYNGNHHWMFFDENLKIFDTGRPNNPNGPRPHAWEINKWIKNKNESQKIGEIYIIINKNKNLNY